jgi:hypothetical protein
MDYGLSLVNAEIGVQAPVTEDQTLSRHRAAGAPWNPRLQVALQLPPLAVLEHRPAGHSPFETDALMGPQA